MNIEDELDRIPSPSWSERDRRLYWEHNRRPFETVEAYRARQALPDGPMKDIIAALARGHRVEYGD